MRDTASMSWPFLYFADERLSAAELSAARLEPSEQRAERELPPLGGFSEVPVRLVRR